MKRVYPRVYGETIKFDLPVWATEGLSPRVRGNHRPRCDDKHPGRSIPACTGKPDPFFSF